MVAPTRGEAAVYLKILELNPHSPPRAEEVKKQWKNLCVRYHPDKHTESAYKKYQEEFKKCQEEGVPYEGKYVLSPKDASAKFVEVTHAYKMLTDREYAFKEKFKESPVVDLNIQIPFGISFDEAFFGTELVLTIAIREYTEEGICLNESERKPFKTETINISVPAGTYKADNFVIKGKGCLCNKKRGDVHLTVVPQPNPKFRMDGHGNVLSNIQIPLHIMLKGGSLEIPTMYGVKTLRVPLGTSPGDDLRIKNCGVQEQGSHIVSVQVPAFPKKGELKDNPDWDGLGFNFDEEEEEDQEEASYEKIYLNLGHGGFRAQTRSHF